MTGVRDECSRKREEVLLEVEAGVEQSGGSHTGDRRECWWLFRATS